MKKTKNPFRIFAVIVVVALIATALVKTAEYYFGMVNVFCFAVAMVAFFGIVVVPILQVNRKLQTSKVYANKFNRG